MRKILISLVMAVFVVNFAFADFQGLISEADALNEQQKDQQVINLLESRMNEARNNREKAEVYWRLARATMNLGSDLEDAGNVDGALAKYQEGEELAAQAVNADANNHLGYFWQSANIGKWGLAKGILNALFKADDMRDLLITAVEKDEKYPDTYNVLSQLHRDVPGFPVSFGDVNAAVSFGRIAVDLDKQQLQRGEIDEIDFDIILELAKTLWARDWNESKRGREQGKLEREYNRADNDYERAAAYEGHINIPNMSDREEAIKLIQDVERDLLRISNRTSGQNDNLEKARELLAEYK